jgi:DNA (cytosine-5)-methyltransferase 1
MPEPLRLGSLCTGYGGLDLAASAVFDVVPVFHAEVDPAAARVLEHRFPGVPNLGDITALDWTAVPPVDVLCAGYPCQTESLAGQRKGVDDARWIWPSVAQAVRVLRPRVVLLENVLGHLSLGFRGVLGDLAASGFDAEWLVCAASDLGACHQRKRLFALAWPADPEGDRRSEGPVPAPTPRIEGQPADPARPAADPDREPVRLEPVPDPRRDGTPVVGVDRPQPAPDSARLAERESADQAHPVAEGRDARALSRRGGLLPTPTASLATKGGPNGCHGDGTPTLTASLATKGGPNGCHGDGSPTLTAAVQPSRWGKYAPAIARHEHFAGRAQPPETEPDKNGKPRLSPRFDEWVMGLPDGWVTDVPGIDYNDALRLCGNGVIPAQGEAAFRELARRACETRT